AEQLPVILDVCVGAVAHEHARFCHRLPVLFCLPSPLRPLQRAAADPLAECAPGVRAPAGVADRDPAGLAEPAVSGTAPATAAAVDRRARQLRGAVAGAAAVRAGA